MKKHFLTIFMLTATVWAINAQGGKGPRIGYIDMEYILQNVPDYNEANIQLENKAQKWKQEIETKKNEISKLKDALKIEEVLLTKELIYERQEEIAFKEKELEEFQQKKFGPTGEFIVQKAVLTKPVQDQVFTIIQDLAEARRYDFIFDRSSDMTMLFAAKRFDVSDYVVRALTRASKRNQMSKKQLKEEEAKEYKETVEDLDPELAEKRKLLDDKKAAREKLLEERKAIIEAKRQEAEAKRKQMIEERAQKKAGGTTKPAETAPSNQTDKKAPSTNVQPQQTDQKVTPKTETEKPTTPEEKAAQRKEIEAAKQKEMDEKRKASEARRVKILAERDSIKKANLEKAKQPKQD